MSTIVPNTFPTIHNVPYRIALIGEAPGRDEEAAGRPFVGVSGWLLNDLLSSAGIIRDACFVGNVCQQRPPENDLSQFAWSGDEIQSGLQQLSNDLAQFVPNICVLLGNTALHAALGEEESVSTWRGTLFAGRGSRFAGRKCIATYHPAALLRTYDWTAVTKFDLKRARQEGETPDLVLPERELITPGWMQVSPELYIDYCIAWLNTILIEKPLISLDIEGGIDTLSCLSIATSANRAFIIPFSTGAGSYIPTLAQEVHLWRTLSKVLSDPRIPKVLQNSLYDNFVLSWSYRCPIRGVVDDTMLKHWERFSELEKSLAFQTSIYTKEPFYKADRKSNNLEEFWRYCCKDSAVTYEINSLLHGQFTPPERLHYRFNIRMLGPIHYMEHRGFLYDYEKAKTRRQSIVEECDRHQDSLNTIAGRELNVASSKQMRAYFYDTLGLPPVTNRKTGSATLNYEALLSLAKKTEHPALLLAIKIRSLTTRARMLEIHPDDDGRIRCGYNIVGTESGRLTCYASPTGSGYNLQTIPEHDRDLFLADPGHLIFQCDLSDADGWTVAAHCANLGDATMLDDMKAGIKIAKVIALMFKEGPEVSYLQRDELKKATDRISKNDPLYFGAKCCRHGSNYGMGKVLLSATIFVQSEGTVNIPAKDAERLQELYFRRYPGVLRWHNRVGIELKSRGYLVSASGHKRLFFGRRDDHATLKAALANEPQENTTYALNLSALRLWNDRSNRRADSRFRVEPLHQVHDALVGQYSEQEQDYASHSIPIWFDNRLEMAGIQLVIPYEGRFGRSWGELTNPL